LISEGAIPFHPSPFVGNRATTGTQISGVLCYKGLFSFPYIFTGLRFSLLWFLIHSLITFLDSAFSETDLKYGKTKCISQAVGGWRRGGVVFLSYKVTLIFFPFYNI